MTLDNFAVLLSATIVVVMGPAFIPYLQKLKFGQMIREEGPQSHLQKQGTPTMGGIMFILAITIASGVAGLYRSQWLYPLVGMWLYGLVGFLDDYIKVVLKRNLGLRAYQKFGLQLAFAVLFAFLTYGQGRTLVLPFTTATLDLGVGYYFFVPLFMAAMTNSVNLTDGLDGLASSVSILVLVFFVVLGIRGEDASLVNLTLISIFALLGFLYFNRYPARVFMGDTGSLAIGGLIGGLALMTGTPLLIVIVGIVFVLVTASVMIQVVSFKLTGRRVFRMAPIHHHFELKGWSEKRIVRVFSLVGAVGLVLGLLMVKG